jgi:hypothetical protein
MGIASLNPSDKFVVRRTVRWVETHFADTHCFHLFDCSHKAQSSNIRLSLFLFNPDSAVEQ